MDTIIFHIDVNSAFLSWTAVEQLKNGATVDLRTIPAIIGGDTKSRHGIVVAKSVPAKAYDIHTAEPVVSAMRKCPNLTVVPPSHDIYKRYSNDMMNLLRTYTPDIEQLSIDECFLDFTPIAHLYESPLSAAQIISNDIKTRFGFTVNIGIAPNKVLAKMASDFTKPDRIHTLFLDEIPGKMWPLPVDDLYMVGKSSANRLKSLGIRTIGELAATDLEYLKTVFKSHGQLMWEYANGIGSTKVTSTKREVKGVGNSITLSQDVTEASEARKVLLRLSESVSARLRKKNQLAQNVTVEIKYSDFTSCSHQTPFFSPTNSTDTIYDYSCQLFDELWNQAPIRLLGVRTAKLIEEGDPVQLSLFDLPSSTTVAAADKHQQIDAAVDSIREKFGNQAIIRGSFLKK